VIDPSVPDDPNTPQFAVDFAGDPMANDGPEIIPTGTHRGRLPHPPTIVMTETPPQDSGTAPVPEPWTLGLFGLGLSQVGWFCRRRNRLDGRRPEASS